MIVNLEKFVADERPHWERLDALLGAIEQDPWKRLPVAEARELERLYQRAAADLARLSTYAAEPVAREYLENLIARGHAEIHGGRAETKAFNPMAWLAVTLPTTFRRHVRAFYLAVAVTLAGVLFGGGAMALDPEAKPVLMPFSALRESPTERVAHEREEAGAELRGKKAQFSGFLMTHNTRVAIATAGLGIGWGVGTLILLFYNGVGLGAVAVDYLMAGQGPFLFGWLLPHGVIEIPAILVAGQAGFVLASAMLDRGRRGRLAARMRAAIPDVATLCIGAALLLVWAGIVEGFFSQYHEPVLPYAVKIGFGLFELAVVAWYFFRVGRKHEAARPAGA